MWLNVLAKLGIIFDKKEGLLMFMSYSFVYKRKYPTLRRVGYLSQ